MGAVTYVGPAAIEVLPALMVYIAWIAFTVVFFVVGMGTVAANSGPLAPNPAADSRFRSELEGESKFRETYKARFGSSEILYVALLNGIAGVLLWFALEARLWAAGMLGVLSVWLIYSHARSPFTLRQMNPRHVGPLDWAYYFTGALAWMYIAACVGQRWSVKL